MCAYICSFTPLYWTAWVFCLTVWITQGPCKSLWIGAWGSMTSQARWSFPLGWDQSRLPMWNSHKNTRKEKNHYLNDKRKAKFKSNWEKEVALSLLELVTGWVCKVLLRAIVHPILCVASSGVQVRTKDSVQTFDLMSSDLSWVFGAKLQTCLTKCAVTDANWNVSNSLIDFGARAWDLKSHLFCNPLEEQGPGNMIFYCGITGKRIGLLF